MIAHYVGSVVFDVRARTRPEKCLGEIGERGDERWPRVWNNICNDDASGDPFATPHRPRARGRRAPRRSRDRLEETSGASSPRGFGVLDGGTLANYARNHTILFQHDEFDLVLPFEGVGFGAYSKTLIDVILDALRDDDVV